MYSVAEDLRQRERARESDTKGTEREDFVSQRRCRCRVDSSTSLTAGRSRATYLSPEDT
jgi:hypothetical protein